MNSEMAYSAVVARTGCFASIVDRHCINRGLSLRNFQPHNFFFLCLLMRVNQMCNNKEV